MNRKQKQKSWHEIIKIWHVLVGTVVLFIGFVVFLCFYFTPATNQQFFVSFSAPYARYLGLNDRETLEATLKELKPKRIRTAAYWDEIEAKRGVYDFSSVEWQLEMAKKYNTEVVLTVGQKLPRWPECFQPAWYKGLSEEDQKQAILNIVKQTVEHFKHYDSIVMWQVENEPIFWFGHECKAKTISFLKQEIELVKSLDPRPTLTTDSGEMGLWIPAALAGSDYFGSTLYIDVYNKILGYIRYPFPPQFWWVKGGLLKLITGKDIVIGAELEAEPWLKDGFYGSSVEEQTKSFDNEKFLYYVDFAKKVGFTDYYLWGVEWWYAMKTKHGHPEYWETAKNIINQ